MCVWGGKLFIHVTGAAIYMHNSQYRSVCAVMYMYVHTYRHATLDMVHRVEG